MMYTNHVEQRLDASGALVGDSFWQIQICPFFLQWALPRPRKSWYTRAISRTFWKTWTVVLAEKIVTFTRYTPIDGASLFDKVMLHELTHANVDGRFGTIDVDLDNGPAYGWKNCRILSTSTPTNNDGPAQNADTWALFGSIAWQIQEGLIAGVTDKGQLIKV
ncbi:hypothetical protein B0O99DRAFT_126186 [Bisporella sp. PMI_857]|nr:hypothetical protein B0O99DRAFT_126186 [Bisporella sp. PMI_857]